ncbi:EF-P lysine aminoacylase EpmA [Thioalkalivibrio sp. HK1]|uniref:EF-P lysine aminoacylase EpmA n=1 Tax=Thioalkalivibrio sp. HK1 TaxID=1469245 RepID=UPI00046FE994|nr:EF-P lysine aminoacylase EpmA [Thioalkalivibrio sp. HK1]
MSLEPRADGQAWRPGIDLDILRLRARYLRAIRAYFDERGVMEVDTPVLCATTVTDPAISSLHTRDRSGRLWYLQTSPEFSMKRLLAMGSGSIFQLSRAFRDGERGRYHNIEFTMLEWYRVGFDHHRLMDDIEALLDRLLGPGEEPARRLSFREAFERFAGFDPFVVDLDTLHEACGAYRFDSRRAKADRDTCLDWLLAEVVQPALGAGRVFVLDFPASRAALAKIRPGDFPVAERFELYIDGIEIANGYHELRDADELRRRMSVEYRRRLGANVDSDPESIPKPDERLIAAHAAGLPACAGVALGFDRLLMLAAGRTGLAQVLPFAGQIA